MANDTGDGRSRAPLPTIRSADSSDMAGIIPARSRTEPQGPDVQRRENKHLPHKLHPNGLRNRAFTSSGGKDHSYRHAAKETLQSAIDLKPPISFDRLLRREKETTDSSRRGSGHQHQNSPQQHNRENGLDGTAQSQAQALREQERPRVNPRDLEKLRRENTLREEELRASLKAVEETAMSSTRQLDDCYYSILERSAALRAIVSNLQQLAEETRKLHATFHDDTTTIASETKGSLDGFGNFDGQEKAIDALVTRLKTSKSQTGTLNERLEAARTRVETFERQEKARERKRRQRWQMSWAVILGIVALLVALAIARRRAAIGSRIHSAAKVVDELAIDLASPVAALLHPGASPSEDAVLRRMFENL